MAEFPSLERPMIIAMKGLPCTLKTFVAASIAKWAGAPVLRIDDFLDSLDGGDEPQQLQRAAFVTLCKVATCQLWGKITNFKCVVIKSRLYSTFELDQLIDLAGLGDPDRSPNLLLIIECQTNNEYRWKEDYTNLSDIRLGSPYERKWYRPKEWNEVVKARLDYDAHAWDQCFLESIEQLSHERRHLVGRLVFTNIRELYDASLVGSIEDPIVDAVNYLLPRDVWDRFQHSVEYVQLLQAIVEEELNTPRDRRKHICANRVGCVFEYREALENYEGGNCRVCEKRILGPGYACHFCTLALHRSCAEDISIRGDYDRDTFPVKYTCDSCKQQGSDFSFQCQACMLQTNLKCRVMPTILNHDAHPQHFLCICLVDFIHTCKGCGCHVDDVSYACKMCLCFYHVQCVNSPQKVKHNHGGYEHVMKLMYTTDGMAELEDFWCDFCHHDIDPQLWFFSCQECPYYVTHGWRLEEKNYIPCKFQ